MQKAPLPTVTDPGDLHQQIQAMIASAQGAPLPMQAPPNTTMAPPATPPPAPMQQPGAPAPAMPQMGGSPQNMQKAMLAKAIRGG